MKLKKISKDDLESHQKIKEYRKAKKISPEAKEKFLRKTYPEFYKLLDHIEMISEGASYALIEIRLWKEHYEKNHKKDNSDCNINCSGYEPREELTELMEKIIGFTQDYFKNKSLNEE